MRAMLIQVLRKFVLEYVRWAYRLRAGGSVGALGLNLHKHTSVRIEGLWRNTCTL